VAISSWPKLSKNDQKGALEKEWYVYYSFRNPTTGRLERQPNIKAGANRFKTKKERLAFLRVLQTSLLGLLQKGFSPYDDNTLLEEKYFGVRIQLDQKQEQDNHCNTDIAIPVATIGTPIVSIEQAFELALKIKQSVLGQTSYSSLFTHRAIAGS
jgi:hypothetical protein